MWNKAKIKIELIKRGSNFTKAALDEDLSSGACRTALVKPFPAGEKALAKALNVSVEELFPERYKEAK